MMRLQAIVNLYSEVAHAKEDGAYDKHGNLVEIDESKVTVETNRFQDEYDALQFQRDRQYPSIGDQLDQQYWDQVNGTTTWKDAVAKVKSDNPKE